MRAPPVTHGPTAPRSVAGTTSTSRYAPAASTAACTPRGSGRSSSCTSDRACLQLPRHRLEGLAGLLLVPARLRRRLLDNRSVGTSALVTHRWDGVERVTAVTGSGWSSWRLRGVPRDSLAPPGLADLSAHRTRVLQLRPGLDRRIPADGLRDPAGALTVARVADRRAAAGGVAAAHARCDRDGHRERLRESDRLPAPSTRAYIVGRAIDFMKLTSPIRSRSRTSARRYRVCPRTLSYAFSGVLGASPKAYLLATRLNRAFRDLADSRCNASIESVASRWGFSTWGASPTTTGPRSANARRTPTGPVAGASRQNRLGFPRPDRARSFSASLARSSLATPRRPWPACRDGAGLTATPGRHRHERAAQPGRTHAGWRAAVYPFWASVASAHSARARLCKTGDAKSAP